MLAYVSVHGACLHSWCAPLTYPSSCSQCLDTHTACLAMLIGVRAQVSKAEFVKAQKTLAAAHKAAAKEALQASYFGSGRQRGAV